MKPKPSTLFINKLSGCLSKLRDTSTIQIGHQQFRQLLQNTELKDVIAPFISKLDSIDRPTDREKKQHSKLYITLIDHFAEQVLLQHHYEKIMQSLAKKTVGVADVIGHLCKGYISRIHPLQNSKNYIIYIMTVFKNHIEIHKIIKQIAQTISPIIVSSLQADMVTMIIQKMQLARQRAEYIEALMGVLLALQDKFQCENIIQPILVKNLKNDDWNVRKACVDICYTFMVVKEQINSVLHELVKQLKYDKIKNVRDSVINYESLYKQIYGEEESFKPQNHSQKTIRMSNQRTVRSPVNKNNNNQNITKSQQVQNISQIKTPGKMRNETFFRNAKDSDIIKVSQDFSNNLSQFNIKSNRSQILMHDSQQVEDQSQVKLRQNRSLYMPSTSSNINNVKPYTKTNSRSNLLNDTVKREKSPKALSPKFNLNFQGIRVKQSQELNTFGQKNKKPLIGDLNNRFTKKQLKILPYDVDADDEEMNKNLNFSLQSQEVQRRQYMPIKKTEIKSYQQKNNDQPDMRKQKQRKLIINQNTYFLPNSTSSDPSTPSLKQDFTQKQPFSKDNLSTQKLSTNFNHSTQSGGQNSILKLEMSQIKAMFDKFQQKIISRIDKLQARVESLEQSHLKLSFGKQAPFLEGKNQLPNLQDSAISLKNDHYYPYEENNLFKKPQQNNKAQVVQSQIQENSWVLYNENESQQAVESNLLQKVNEALRNHNIDEAYSVALANNKVPLLMKLLQSLHIPTDRTVQECLLLEIKKQVSRKEVLKWLKNYLVEKMTTIKSYPGGSAQKMLIKIRTQLIKQNKPKEKDYDLLKTIVLNQMQEIFESNR